MISPVDRLSGLPFCGHGDYQIGPWQAVGIDEFKGYANQSRGDVGITPFVAPPGLFIGFRCTEIAEFHRLQASYNGFNVCITGFVSSMVDAVSAQGKRLPDLPVAR